MNAEEAPGCRQFWPFHDDSARVQGNVEHEAGLRMPEPDPGICGLRSKMVAHDCGAYCV